MNRALLTATLAAAFCSSLATAQVAFERLAPENSIFIAGVNNVNAARGRFERTSLHTLWRSDDLSEMREAFKGRLAAGLAQAAGELGIEREDIVWPTGEVGFALFPVIDPERGMPSAAYVLYTDYGDRADAFERVVRALLQRGVEDGELEVDEREILGRAVRTITMVGDDPDEWGIDEDEDDWGFDDDDWGFEDDFFDFGIGADVMADFQTVHLVREGSAFLLCSDLGSITEVLDRIDRDRPSGLGERADFRNALELIGANDAYAVVLSRDVGQLIQAFDPTGMAMMFTPMLQGLFGEISAMSAGVLFDAPEAMVRNNFAVAMPRGKRGLSALVDVSKPRGPLPAFTGADAFSYSAFNFAFGRVADVAQQFVQENPMLAMMGAGEMLEGVDPLIRQFTAGLGETVHFVSSGEGENVHTVIAVDVTDPLEMEAMITHIAPPGMVAQEINGHRVYTTAPVMPMPMPGMAMPEMAIAVGPRHLLVGPVPSVIEALALTEDADRVGGLAEQATYRAAVGRIPDVPLVTWGYMDVVTMIESTIRAAEAASRQMMPFAPMPQGMLGEFDDEDDDEAIGGDFAGQIDFELLRRYLGPSVSWMRSTEAGFVGTMLWLSADEGRE